MIFITGITGLTGRFLLEEVRRAGYQGYLRCLVRKSSDVSWIQDDKVELYEGNVNDYASIIPALYGVSAVIHLVNIRSSPQIICACQEADVKRVVFINTTGIYSKHQQYAEEYKELEAKMLNCGLDYTIIRPTMIYGNQRDKNIHKLVRLVERFPVIPVIGSGYGLMQPIYARDLAIVIARSCLCDESIGKAYNVAGKEPVRFSDILKTIAVFLGKKRLFINIPYSFALLVAHVGEHIPNGLIDIEKILRLQEDKVFLYEEAARDLGFSPLSFEEGVQLEITALREAGIIR